MGVVVTTAVVALAAGSLLGGVASVTTPGLLDD
jgi:hypothetical protein